MDVFRAPAAPGQPAGLALLGNKLSARQAAGLGPDLQCVADDEFDSALDGLAAHFAQAPTKGLAFTKRALQASLGNDLSTSSTWSGT